MGNWKERGGVQNVHKSPLSSVWVASPDTSGERENLHFSKTFPFCSPSELYLTFSRMTCKAGV
jgi:hypothetical protein